MTTSTHGTSRLAIQDGDRQLRRTCIRFGEEIRAVRIRAGVSQAAVGRTIGVSRSVICRMEQGDPNVSARIRARASAALGADFRMALYPASAPLIHDAAHAGLVEAVLGMCHPRWGPTVEAPVPGPGRRSTGLRLDRGDDLVLIEVETRIHALEAIIREVAEKRSAVTEAAGPGHRVHAVLVLPPTRHHLALVRAHPGTVAVVFPMPPEQIASALRSGSAPIGDGILWLSTRSGGRPSS